MKCKECKHDKIDIGGLQYCLTDKDEVIICYCKKCKRPQSKKDVAKFERDFDTMTEL